MSPLWGGPGSSTLTQAVIIDLPALSIGANDITVIWPFPFIDASYSVPKPGVEGGGLLSNRTADLKAGSRTASQCVVTVTNSGLVSIGAGAVLHVTASQSY